MAQKTIPSGARRLAKTDYRNLMRRRIRRILLICSSYDAYTLEEDGRLEVQLNHEYMELNLSNPAVVHAGEQFDRGAGVVAG